MKLRWLCVVAISGLGLGNPTSAGACINGVEIEEDPRVAALAAADAALKDGAYLKAAKLAASAHPNFKNGDDRPRLASRAIRVLALVTIRTNGLVFERNRLIGGADFVRQKNLEWAVSKLQRRSMHQANAPAPLSDLGEALTRLPERHDEARRILEHLAERQLLTSAQAYAALARLRAASGDALSSAEALNACKRLSRHKHACEA